jgi:hypothetical protein
MVEISPLFKGEKMAKSRTADALGDLLDVLDEHFSDQPATDQAKALVANAERELDTYYESERDSMDMVGDQVRHHLARIVQYVNENHPDLTGTPEMERALDILANPHGPGGTATMSNRGVPTPFANDEETLRREQQERRTADLKSQYTQGQVQETRRADDSATAREAAVRADEDTREPERARTAEAKREEKK